MENAIRRVPDLENAQVNLLLNGPEGFTPRRRIPVGSYLGQRFLDCSSILRARTRGRRWHWQGDGRMDYRRTSRVGLVAARPSPLRRELCSQKYVLSEPSRHMVSITTFTIPIKNANLRAPPPLARLSASPGPRRGLWRKDRLGTTQLVREADE